MKWRDSFYLRVVLAGDLQDSWNGLAVRLEHMPDVIGNLT